jgi:hypothetical protein
MNKFKISIKNQGGIFKKLMGKLALVSFTFWFAKYFMKKRQVQFQIADMEVNFKKI